LSQEPCYQRAKPKIALRADPRFRMTAIVILVLLALMKLLALARSPD